MKAAITTLALLVALTLTSRVQVQVQVQAQAQEPELYKDPLVALYLSATLPGLGQFYTGDKKRALGTARWSSRMQPAERCCTSWSGRLTGYRTRLSSGREQMSAG